MYEKNTKLLKSFAYGDYDLRSGAKGEDRTRDPSFTKAVLYQLSYFGTIYWSQ